MPLDPARDVLLFYEDYDHDTFFKNDRHLRRRLRQVVYRFRRGKPKVTGFLVWFQLLKKALEQGGRRVHVNKFRLAARNPSAPVGICGYPQVLNGWSLPNPAVLGPGLWDHPSLAPRQMEDPRFRVYVTTCDWHHDMFAPVYGPERCAHWHAGFDLADWPEQSRTKKDVDVLIYDKVRWERDRYEPSLLAPLRRLIAARGLRSETLRYGRYDHASYRALLQRSRSMAFLCEHETQGMAYQEALASNVPIIAWDPGEWRDPNAKRFDTRRIWASSVPFFDETCGERFREPEEMEQVFDRFWAKLTSYEPRGFAARELSMAQSAQTYLELLARAAREGAR